MPGAEVPEAEVVEPEREGLWAPAPWVLFVCTFVPAPVLAAEVHPPSVVAARSEKPTAIASRTPARGAALLTRASVELPLRPRLRDRPMRMALV